jgi:hypothetical protein
MVLILTNCRHNLEKMKQHLPELGEASGGGWFGDASGTARSAVPPVFKTHRPQAFSRGVHGVDRRP